MNEEADKTEILDIGCFAQLPAECILKESELIGYKQPKEDIESDFDDDDEQEEENKSSEAFYNEVMKTIERSSKDQIANAITEVKSLKMSYNKSQSDCIESMIPPLLSKIT